MSHRRDVCLNRPRLAEQTFLHGVRQVAAPQVVDPADWDRAIGRVRCWHLDAAEEISRRRYGRSRLSHSAGSSYLGDAA